MDETVYQQLNNCYTLSTESMIWNNNCTFDKNVFLIINMICFKIISPSLKVQPKYVQLHFKYSI